ncbi:MAG: hypothetical protein KGL69_04040 [Alphaproteobacteria bacterium]|nr:hypothetical protein [Alphaproteobacteria bacterium]
MAEKGGIEGALGGEGEDAGESPSVGAPLADAVALDEAGASAEARAYLIGARRLVEIQTEHLHEQRAVQIALLRWRRLGEALKVGLQALIALVAAALAAGLGVMAWDAAHDHGLVVEAFSVPPDLAARGLTGQVVAKQVLDRLAALQAQTQSMRAASTFTNDWGDDLKVEIPETGVSLGEAQRYLRAWLGHETRITGEIFEGPGGLTITARSGDDPTPPVTGPGADLDGVLEKTAEALYARTQPYRYSALLVQRGDVAGAHAILVKLTTSPTPQERAWAHNGLAVEAIRDHGDVRAAEENVREELGILSDFSPAYFGLSLAEALQGHDEGVLHAAQSLRRAVRRRPGEVAPDQDAYFIRVAGISTAFEKGDFTTMVQLSGGADRSVSFSHYASVDALPYAEIADHDPLDAQADSDAGDIQPVPVASAFAENGHAQELQVQIALERGDPSALGLARALWAQDAAFMKDRGDDPKGIEDIVLRDDGPYLALAEARFGDPAAARALAASFPPDCYPCQWTRGDVAALAHDRATAESAFALAIADGPDLPKAYVERGVARLGWGDLTGAMADAQKAHALGPRYADPLKLWGDVLARRGDWRGAKAKYAAALPLAPHWTALQAARRLAQTKV